MSALKQGVKQVSYAGRVFGGVRSVWAGAARLRGVGALVLAAVLSAPLPAAAVGDRPDLVPELPQVVDATQVAPVYVDAFTRPGRLLYRFDATLRNTGGTLDLFRDGRTGHAMQAVWRRGIPSRAPDPNVRPSGDDVTILDRSDAGAAFEYVFEPGHDHWHFRAAARYELLVPDGAARVSDKVGFCLFDGLGQSRFFPPWYTGSGSQTWCAFDHPESTFTRMGLSPGLADRYRSQRHFQWVDVTGLEPGAYALRAVANPAGYVAESQTSNNAVAEPRTIPGVRLDDAEVVALPGTPVAIDLRATVVAPEIPARASGGCEPNETERDCYVWASEDGRLHLALKQPPQHGSVAVHDGTQDRPPSVTYTSAATSSGEDLFTVVATDARALTSRPATITVTTTARPPGDGASQPTSADDAVPLTAVAPVLPLREAVRPPERLLVTSARLVRRGKRWFAVLRLAARARIRVTVRRSATGTIVRRYRPRRLTPGTQPFALGRLRPRNVVRLVVATRTARQTIVLRRPAINGA